MQPREASRFASLLRTDPRPPRIRHMPQADVGRFHQQCSPADQGARPLQNSTCRLDNRLPVPGANWRFSGILSLGFPQFRRVSAPWPNRMALIVLFAYCRGIAVVVAIGLTWSVVAMCGWVPV